MEVLRMPSASDLTSVCSSSLKSAASSSFSSSYQPEWRPDAVSDACLGCGKAFSFLCRRHHCRACGELVCADCSPSTALVPHVRADRPVRVCKQCNTRLGLGLGFGVNMSPSQRGFGYFSGSDGSSDCEPSELDELDDETVIPWAVEVLAAHSLQKESTLCYDYFVQSEAVSWLVDAHVVKKRRAAVAVFTRLVEDEYVVVKPWSGSQTQRTVFYRINNGKCADGPSQHGGSMHAQTAKCRNCQQWFLESLTPAPGFCSIDCKTNALISQADNARVKNLL